MINLLKPNILWHKQIEKMLILHPEHKKYLNFFFTVLYQFSCISKGSGTAMRIFTKSAKASFLHLRSMGHSSVEYMHQSYIQEDTYKSYLDNRFIYSETWVFYIPTEVSYHPKQTVVCLGYAISSTNMTLSLIYENKAKIKKLSKDNIVL